MRSGSLRKRYTEEVTGTRGRQQEAARNDRKVLDAAREVFATQGWDAPVSAVAERAGVGMGTLYRRYGSKTELLQRLCVLAMEQNIAAAEQSLAMDDPWDALSSYVHACVGFSAGAFAPLAGTLQVTDEMISTARRGSRLLARLVKHSQASGALRSDVTATDLSCVIEQFSRPSANPGALFDHLPQARTLAIALDGLRPEGAHPLPGPAPSAHIQAARWRATSRAPETGFE
jgi:AcrR family transcriptional regulator